MLYWMGISSCFILSPEWAKFLLLLQILTVGDKAQFKDQLFPFLEGNNVIHKMQSPVLCPDLCSWVGFHWGPACRVCGGLHLARGSGQCRLWGPIPAGHCVSTALHRPRAGQDRTQGGCPFCLPWCYRKGKQDTILWRRRMFKNLQIWLNPST